MSADSAKLQLRPKKIERVNSSGLRIVWKDDHVSEYAYPYLRRLCPCAGCTSIRHSGQDVHSLFGPSGEGDVSRIPTIDAIRPTTIELVGRYAIQFAWSDGHASGIYSFDTLREICPCDACGPHRVGS